MNKIKKSAMVSLVAAALMVSAGIVAKQLTPTVKIADQRARFELAAIVPLAFGDWTVDDAVTPLQVDPDTQSKIDKLYNQTLSRTYINRRGERVMLSIAYGGDQSDNLSVHLPEICYAAQGFEVAKTGQDNIATAFGAVPVKRLFAVNGSRKEPISYWVTIGDKAIRPGLEQRLYQMRYGLTGVVPDAMLVRVSSIDADAKASYALQNGFVKDMLANMAPVDRLRLVGSFPL